MTSISIAWTYSSTVSCEKQISIKTLESLGELTVKPWAMSSSGTRWGWKTAGVIQGRLTLTGSNDTIISPFAKNKQVSHRSRVCSIFNYRIQIGWFLWVQHSASPHLVVLMAYWLWHSFGNFLTNLFHSDLNPVLLARCRLSHESTRCPVLLAGLWLVSLTPGRPQMF